MAERAQDMKEKSGTKRPEEQTAPPPQNDPTVVRTVATGKRIKDDIDGLVDEIDDVLVENAEEFVRSYVQRGGE